MPSVSSWGFPALGHARALQVINTGAITVCYQFAGAVPHPVDLSGLMENIWKLSFPKQERCWDCGLEQFEQLLPSASSQCPFCCPSPPSPQWTGFKKENSKPCLKAICGRRWAQLWSADFLLLENLRCAGGFSVCLSISLYLCVYKDILVLQIRWKGGDLGTFCMICHVGFFGLLFFSPTFSGMKAEVLHKWQWKKKYFSSLQQEQVVPRGEGLEAKMGKCVTQSCGLHGSCAHA